MKEPTMIMMHVKVAGAFCRECQKMDLEHMCRVCAMPDEEGHRIAVKQSIWCKHIDDCLLIAEAIENGRKADERDGN